ncbi:MAG: BppU family phage baseplate upper protein [Clostridium chrysemydis]|uniref:BppU family phage baseplate upper protein n=1 Tax=Clostridium chrysemydis TaxID=2665504 RepID=UPI003F2BA5DE
MLQELYIDLKVENKSYISIVQGDNNSEEYKIIVLEDGHRVDLTNRTVRLAFCNSLNDNEGDIISNLETINAKEGELYLPITRLLSKDYGNFACQLSVSGPDEVIKHSQYFTLSIKENLFLKLGSSIPDDKYEKLTSLLDAVERLDESLKNVGTLLPKLKEEINAGQELLDSLGDIKDLSVLKKQIDALSTNFDKLKDLYMSGKLLNDEYFNIAVIHETKDKLDYIEFWLLINARYDHVTGRFKRINVNNFSFGWQMQGGGTYPGEEGYDNINQGMNLWKANGKKAYGINDPAREQTGEDIGAVQSDGKWRTFGIMLGWNNIFMNDSYGGMTIGGAGFEIDGNGMSPFKRVSLGKFTGGSNKPGAKPQDYQYCYNGDTWNTQHGMWNMDENKLDSYFWGMVCPVDWYDMGNTFNPYSNRAKLSEAKYVIRHLPPNVNSHLENWDDIFEIDCTTGTGKIKGKQIATTLVVDAAIVNKTDFNMNYPDGSWNKNNTLILGVKGILDDGSVKQFGNINATYTDYGIFGYLGAGYKSAKIILTKCSR